MREDLLAWATAIVGPILEVHPLHDGQGPWRLVTRDRSVVLRAPTPRVGPAMIATGATALRVAERHHLPAPRLIAADLSASLETDLPGTTSWPVGTPETLRAAGAALTRLHAIELQPADHLPFRPRPIAVDDFATDRRTGRMPTTALLDEADNVVRAHGLPPSPSVFLHGDVWPGNMLWSAGTVAALIDWKTAGVGAPGVDLSELRKQTAITFGPTAPAHVLEGWQQAIDREALHVSYWDAVAALNTRTTLYSPLATTRRDDFLREALSQLH
ncbi:aminoglycoside phosphotransferase family protein [Kribbella karoonensis]|uniref:Aminoglycoside phosphotransferase domain-containing protein n=1 Tax=Kribbella karoonensis TaxID=324851 RepID=A0ABN2DF08_9ACTN